MNSDVLSRLVLAAGGASEALAPTASPESRRFAKQLLDKALGDVKTDADLQKRKDAEFGGETYDPGKDKNRLTRQLGRVFEAMKDGKWRTLSLIVECCGRHNTEAAISARLRDLRKPQFGGYVVERRGSDVHRGLFEYRLLAPDGKVIGSLPNAPAQAAAATQGEKGVELL